MNFIKKINFLMLSMVSYASMGAVPKVTNVEWVSETSLRVTVGQTNYFQHYYHVLHQLFTPIDGPSLYGNKYSDSRGALAITPQKEHSGFFNQFYMVGPHYSGSGNVMYAKDVLNEMAQKLPGTYILNVPSDFQEKLPNGYCVIAGYALGNHPSNGMWIAENTDPCKSATAVIPPPPAWCAPVNNVAIDFGTLSSSEIAESEKSSSLDVYCSAAARYVIKLSTNSDSVSLSNGGVAKIKIAGAAPGTVQSASSAGTTRKTITATLSGVKSGSFRGTSVIRIEML